MLQKYIKNIQKIMFKSIIGLALLSPLALGGPSPNFELFRPQDNTDCESGKGKWTASTASQLTTTTSALMGIRSCVFDGAATNDFAETALVTIPIFMRSQTCVVSYVYSGGDANQNISARDGSGVLVGSAKTLAVQASPIQDSFSVTCPSSGSLKVRITSTANSAAITIDEIKVSVINTQLAVSSVAITGTGEIIGATSCSWELASQTTIANFPDDDQCPALSSATGSMGQLAGSGTDNRPGFRISSLPAGTYLFIIDGPMGCVGGDGDDICTFQLFDGTTVIAETTVIGATMGTGPAHLMGVFTESTGRSNVDFVMRGMVGDSGAGETPVIRLNDDAGTTPDQDADAKLKFKVIRIK